MTIRAKVDASSALAGLDRLRGPLRESLARSMGVAGGRVIRDEARVRVRVFTGRLQQSIYLAYDDRESTQARVIYSISWNSKTAPHGHLEEFGHWQTHVAYQGKDGQWYSGERLPAPRWIAASPFLRPAFDATRATVQKVMIQRARERLPELLAGRDGGQHE